MAKKKPTKKKPKFPPWDVDPIEDEDTKDGGMKKAKKKAKAKKKPKKKKK